MESEMPELTEVEQELIRKHFKAYRALATGKHLPQTEAQRHFAADGRGGGTACGAVGAKTGRAGPAAARIEGLVRSTPQPLVEPRRRARCRDSPDGSGGRSA